MEASSTSSCCLCEPEQRNDMRNDFLNALNAVKNMFKIIENENGITSVYSSSTGKLVCTVRNSNSLDKKPKSPLKSVNYLKPTNPKCCQPQDINQDIKPIFLKKEPSLNEPLPPLPPEEPEFDYDCVDDVTFFSLLNLVETKKLKTVALEKLRKQLPSKSHLSSPTNDAKKDLNIRLFEKISFSSNLARHCAKCMKRNAINPLFSINNYEKFCALTIPPNLSLRNREQLKDFPITYRHKKVQYVHYFPFSKADKEEKKLRLRTHLDKRSRDLKNKCKKAVVRLKKLTREEVSELMKVERPPTMPFVPKELKPCSVSLTKLEHNLIYKKPFFYLDNVKLSHSSINILKNKLHHVTSYFSTPKQKINGKPQTSSIIEAPKDEKAKPNLDAYPHLATNGLGPTENGRLSDDDDEVQIVHIEKKSMHSNFSTPSVNIVRPFLSKKLPVPDLPPSMPSPYQAPSRTSSHLPPSSKSHSQWKLQLPITVNASQWTFICHRCNMRRLYTDKELAAQQMTQHLLNHQLVNPEKEIRQFCIKYGNHLEVTVQAFVKT